MGLIANIEAISTVFLRVDQVGLIAHIGAVFLAVFLRVDSVGLITGIGTVFLAVLLRVDQLASVCRF